MSTGLLGVADAITEIGNRAEIAAAQIADAASTAAAAANVTAGVSGGAGASGQQSGAQTGADQRGDTTSGVTGGGGGLAWAGPGNASSQLIDALRALGGRTRPPVSPAGST